MHEYVLMLNMIEYALIYLKKQSAEYVRILNAPDAWFLKLWHFNKHFVKKNNKKKKPLREIFWRFFLLDTLKTTFWMAN